VTAALLMAAISSTGSLGADGAKAPKPGKTAKTKPAAKPASNDPNSSDYQSGGYQPGTGADRDKLLESVKEQLAQFKTSNKKAEDDFFAINTIQVVEHQVTVEYPIYHGEQETAERVADFLGAPPKKAVRKWYVVGRAKTLKAAEGIVAKAKTKSIEGKLAALPLTRIGKRSPDDAFVVGTAEIKGDHADVRFQVVQGVKDTAHFILDFIFGGGEEAKRQWHVFCRAPNESDANKFVEQLRSDYDRLEAQRQAVAAAYSVRSTRRC
jgi:hypothetical protein